MRKIILALFIVIVGMTVGCSHKYHAYLPSSGENKKYSAFQYDNGDDYVCDGLYRIVDERGKIGYADEKGNTIIPPRFAFGFPFENGKAKVTDSGQEKEVQGSREEYHYWESDDWYYIDKTGRRSDD